MRTLPIYSPIRFFLSSTFADFTAEREVLQRHVFPPLRQLCRTHGVAFQPIDLRWGVSDEASTQQRTLPILFEQLRRCQQVSPDWSLLILLGDRYGSRLPPVTIPQDQFTHLHAALPAPERHLLDTWYQLDENAVPPVLVLRPRTDPAHWQAQGQAALLAALAEGSRRAGFPPERALPYTGSITHQEIFQGLLAPARSPVGVFAVLRSFTPRPAELGTYDETDPEAQAQLRALRAAITAKLPASQVLQIPVPWVDGQPRVGTEDLAAAYLAFLQPVVEAAIERREREEGDDPIHRANQRFHEERTAQFVGRAAPLAAIAAYLAAPARTPLILTGPSGVGKSTLLSVAEEQARQAWPTAVLLARYIGVTPGTASLRDVLVGLRQAILAAYGQPEPDAADHLVTLMNTFPSVLAQATAAHPVILVIDALDQLGPSAQPLGWLPRALPAHAHVILSLLDDRPELAELHAQLPPDAFLPLGAMSVAEGTHLLDRWLAEAGRRVQPAQAKAVLEAFAGEGRPLYLRLAFEQARQWPSFDPPVALPPTIPALLQTVFAGLEHQGDQFPLLLAHALGDLVAAREGLAEEEVLDILAQDSGVRKEQRHVAPRSPAIDPALPLPVALWAGLHGEVERYFTERDGSGVWVITPYHRQVRDALEQRYLAGADGTERHHDLATYFTARPLTDGVLPNERKLVEQAYQQEQSGDRDALHQTLTDLSFLTEQLAVRGVTNTLEEVERGKTDP